MTLLRQWAMLKAIPRAPHRKSTTQIYEALRQQDHAVDKRTVQRDLDRLSSMFPYTSESQGRSQLWFWPQDAALLDLPAMDVPLAVAFMLSREYLTPMLPPPALQLIGPYFSRAEELLAETPGTMAAWRSRICVLSRGPRLKAAKIPDDLNAEVYDAVLGGMQIEATYAPRGKEPKQYTLHPFGLVVFEGVVYLIATANDHQDPVMWPLHRLKAAKQVNKRAYRTPGFNLDAYARKAFRFPVSEDTLKLVAVFDTNVVKHLQERPLADDQVCEQVGDKVQLTATVADTEDLRWWLLGFGDFVEVLKPAKLRADMKKRLEAAAKRYG